MRFIWLSLGMELRRAFYNLNPGNPYYYSFVLRGSALMFLNRCVKSMTPWSARLGLYLNLGLERPR